MSRNTKQTQPGIYWEAICPENIISPIRNSNHFTSFSFYHYELHLLMVTQFFWLACSYKINHLVTANAFSRVCLSVSQSVRQQGVGPHVGADQVFSVGGGANIRFCQNCTEIKKIWALRARTERARPYIHHYHVIGSVQTCSLGNSLAPPFPQTCWQAGCWPSTKKALQFDNISVCELFNTVHRAWPFKLVRSKQCFTPLRFHQCYKNKELLI